MWEDWGQRWWCWVFPPRHCLGPQSPCHLPPLLPRCLSRHKLVKTQRDGLALLLHPNTTTAAKNTLLEPNGLLYKCQQRQKAKASGSKMDQSGFETRVVAFVAAVCSAVRRRTRTVPCGHRETCLCCRLLPGSSCRWFPMLLLTLSPPPPSSAISLCLQCQFFFYGVFSVLGPGEGKSATWWPCGLRKMNNFPQKSLDFYLFFKLICEIF